MKRAETHPQMNPSADDWSAELVELYRVQFSRFVREAERIVCDRALAEECVQDVFLAYHRKRPVHDAGRLLAYVRTMVRNAAITKVRGEARNREALASIDRRRHTAASPEDVVVAAQAAKELLGQLDQLPGRQLQVIDCRLGGLSVDETADVLQISSGSVKTHRFRARAALRQHADLLDAA